MKLAIQGAAGSFHHEAANKLMGTEFDILPAKTFGEVFEAVANGSADAGLVAVENNIYGPLNEVYRLFERSNVWVNAEVRLHIRQQLIGWLAEDIEMLRKQGDAVRILSQAPALAQVEQWLDTHLPEAIREETHDTAESVHLVVKEKNPLLFAVAGTQAAELYGGVIVAQNITDQAESYTRFWRFSNNRTTDAHATACSLILKTRHEPGSLAQALLVFARYHSNISRLASHPIVGDAQHYQFYIDVDSPVDSAVMHAVLDELKALGCTVRILGSYEKQ